MRKISNAVKQVWPGVFGYDFTFSNRRYRRYFRGLSKDQVETIYLDELEKLRKNKYGLDQIEPPKPILFEEFANEYLENYADKKKSKKTYYFQVNRLKDFFSGRMNFPPFFGQKSGARKVHRSRALSGLC